MEGPGRLAKLLIAGARAGEVGATEGILHRDVEWYASVGGLEPSTVRGADNVRRAFDEYHRSWERHTFGEEAVVEAGDRVLLLVREIARGLGSGLDVEQGTAVLVTTVDGLITSIVTYLEPSAGVRRLRHHPRAGRSHATGQRVRADRRAHDRAGRVGSGP